MLNHPATLDNITDAQLDQLAHDGFDLVWFLGVWQTGEAARRVSASNPEWRVEFQRILLPDFQENDVSGSCFAISDYHVHRDFGGDNALARLRERLHSVDCVSSSTLSPTTSPPTIVGSMRIQISLSKVRRSGLPLNPRITAGSIRLEQAVFWLTAEIHTSLVGLIPFN
jgi:hypothetical protein